MRVLELCCQLQSSAMWRCAVVRNGGSVRAAAGAANCLLAKHLPSSKVDYTASAVALRERLSNSGPSHRRGGESWDKNQQGKQPAYRDAAPGLEITAGGGPRPRTPRVWKTRTRKGSIAKSEKLMDVINKLSNVKEEIYGSLDAWIAWDLEFPLIPVKKALRTLKDEGQWRRIIQVSKWMLDKGQGKTLATYLLLLEALDHEGRVEEAEVLWGKVLTDNMECIPRAMFARMISMYDRYDKPKELLKVFADMEELGVKPDLATMEKVSRTYTKVGYPEYAEALKVKYQASPEGRWVKGRRSVQVSSEKGEEQTAKHETTRSVVSK